MTGLRGSPMKSLVDSVNEKITNRKARWIGLLIAVAVLMWGLVPRQEPIGIESVNSWDRPAMTQGPSIIEPVTPKDPEETYRLAISHLTGEGAAKNLNKAVRLCTEAAEAGHPAAQEGLGLMYHTGMGVPKDVLTAALWYERAAKQGRSEAAYSLGLMHAWGELGPRDDTEAAWWIMTAAEAGLPEAQWTLGLMYGRGEGLPRDRNMAMKWIQAAAEGGLTCAGEALASRNSEMLDIMLGLDKPSASSLVAEDQ